MAAEIQGQLDQLERSVDALKFPVVAPESVLPGVVSFNDSPRPLFLTFSCNATGAEQKDLEVRIGPNAENIPYIAGESGGDRLAGAAIVPPGWYFRIATSRPRAEGCIFLRWRI